MNQQTFATPQFDELGPASLAFRRVAGLTQALNAIHLAREE